MGLFDRKREEPTPTPEVGPAPAPAGPVVQAQPKVDVSAKTPAAAPEPAAAPKASFGIEKAMELMRKLPADNVPLVVQVVLTTLESANVNVASIVSEARDKRTRIGARIDGMQAEISDFEEEIAARREQITLLQADQAETKLVQERLEMAIKGTAAPNGKASMEKAVFEDAVPKPRV
ncbi:MAG: hypothetical protein K0V04_18765 [Deltaproteobacteria bacterium]|nr:hypothetical protein [Deltaproteobacteria bacterium]